MNGEGLSIVAVVIQATLAAIAIGVGSWGRSYSPALLPGEGDEERVARIAVIRRGTVACLVVGWILAASVLWALFSVMI